MKGLRPPSLRVIGRLFRLAGKIAVIFADYFFRCAFQPENAKLAARALWLQRSSRSLLKIFRLELEITGPIPSVGLLVCNHLSYLDIPALASATPAVFVAKREVKSWPVFGPLAQLAGTLFVDRERRTQVGQTNEEIQNALDRGALVVLFPEGTSSDGRMVLPFKTSLLEPAARRNHPISTGHIRYALDDGNAANEVCYWGGHVFFKHLLNLMGRRTVRAEIRFGKFESTIGDRKELALQLHAEVLKLKSF